MDKYISVITNFGCHYSCPYCVVKNTGIDIPKTTVQGLDTLRENIEKYGCNWVSISGGGDPFHNFDENLIWHKEFISVVPDDVKLELHTSYIKPSSPINAIYRFNFDRIVYHCHNLDDLSQIKRYGKGQIVRAVFVVDDHFTTELIDEIAKFVKNSSNIDELSFRQMVDSDYNDTHYCEDYLKAGHKKDWYYIEQNDYNIYYAENEVKFKFNEFKKV